MNKDGLLRIKNRVTHRLNARVRADLARARARVNELSRLEKSLEVVLDWHQYLINGETTGGTFGCCPTFAYFVRRYSVGEKQRNNLFRLIDTDLIIIPDVLVAHALRVEKPSADRPGVRINTSETVSVPDIVARMLAHAHSASNVTVGTFDQVLIEPCSACKSPSLVAGLDAYFDDDNGSEFFIARLCESCDKIGLVASFADYSGGQYGKPSSLYRSPSETA